MQAGNQGISAADKTKFCELQHTDLSRISKG